MNRNKKKFNSNRNVTFDQFNTSWLVKSINFFKKNNNSQTLPKHCDLILKVCFHAHYLSLK